ncbi:MAG: hypothetical protein ACM358_05625 [Gemmatimonadota bacterium]
MWWLLVFDQEAGRDRAMSAVQAMSEPFAGTNETRVATCASCGRDDVIERKLLGLYGSIRWWKDKHDAKCGLPCFGAGVYGPVYKSGHFHRDLGDCPACDK